jgi:hypothetical protein
MGKQIYDKPIWIIFKDFANELREDQVFKSEAAVDWFKKNYTKEKKISVQAHLVRLTTNNPNRVHHKATMKDDLFFRVNLNQFRKYNPSKDPEPIYEGISQQKRTRLIKKPRFYQVEARIDDLINNFQYYLNYFTEHIKFSGPSIYFHKKAIEKIRNCESYDRLFDDDLYFDYLYATLVSWGMHKMEEKGPKMVDYDKFKGSIRSIRQHLIDLREYRLEDILEGQVNWVKKKLKYIFNSLKIMAREAKLVGNSKALHHLLPDLATPIDRQHTLRFFYNNLNINTQKEEKMFLELFDKFRYISQALKGDNFTFTGFNTSIPKIIDNAIIGYVMKNLKPRK